MALYLSPTTTLQIWFTTVAAPTLSSGDAIRITSGNVDIRNTIIADHATVCSGRRQAFEG